MENQTSPNPDSGSPNTNDAAQAELDALMGQYKTAGKVIQETAPTETTQPVQVTIDTTTQPVATDPDAPFGRYQRGKLKGQPRKTPYISAKGVSSMPVTQQPLKPTEPPKLSGMLISGALFLMLVNLCLPLGFSVINNFFNKDKLNPEHLKLTKEQIKELDPVCDAAMKQASVTGNPVLLLVLGICTAMGLNYMVWKMGVDEKKLKDQKNGIK